MGWNVELVGDNILCESKQIGIIKEPKYFCICAASNSAVFFSPSSQ
jgi:hypothetical protein